MQTKAYTTNNQPEAQKCFGTFAKILASFFCMAISMLPSCTRTIDFPKQQMGSEYYRDFYFKYDGKDFHIHLSFDKALYDFYHAKNKDTSYESYAHEDARYPYLAYVAQELEKVARPYHFNQKQMAEFILCFSQSIPYFPDPSGCEYVRDPIVTIIEGQGDCEDLSLVAASLWHEMGYASTLIAIDDQAHMAAGVEIEGYYYQGYSSRHSGHHYAFAECTHSGWELGLSTCPDNGAVLYEIGNDGRGERIPAMSATAPGICGPPIYAPDGVRWSQYQRVYAEPKNRAHHVEAYSQMPRP